MIAGEVDGGRAAGATAKQSIAVLWITRSNLNHHRHNCKQIIIIINKERIYTTPASF
jgi:ABC-type iron transport system FetAB ATPase subunit